jgi:hypothetical protein
LREHKVASETQPEQGLYRIKCAPRDLNPKPAD